MSIISNLLGYNTRCSCNSYPISNWNFLGTMLTIGAITYAPSIFTALFSGACGNNYVGGNSTMYTGGGVSSSSVQSDEQKLINKNSEINAQLNILGKDATDDNYNSFTIEAKYDKDIKAAADEIERIQGANGDGGELKKVNDEIAEIESHKADDGSYTADQQSTLRTLEAKKQNLETALKNAQKAKEDAEEAKAARQKEIDAAKAEITKLLEERKKIEADLKKVDDKKVWEKADGTAISRGRLFRDPKVVAARRAAQACKKELKYNDPDKYEDLRKAFIDAYKAMDEADKNGALRQAYEYFKKDDE